MVARSVAKQPPAVLVPKVNLTAVAKSCGEIPAGFPVNLHRLRTVFPDRWQSFIKAHFRSVREVQFALDVSEKTARDYWFGRSSPRAEVALYAVATYDDALPLLMGAA